MHSRPTDGNGRQGRLAGIALGAAFRMEQPLNDYCCGKLTGRLWPTVRIPEQHPIAALGYSERQVWGFATASGSSRPKADVCH